MRLRSSLLAAGIAMFAMPAVAAADPITYNGQDGSTATLSSSSFQAGERIHVSGTGFIGMGGPGSTGYPVVAIKLNDGDDPPLTHGGEDAIESVEPGLPSFEANPDGSFSGWLDLPEDIGPVGPEGAGPYAGQHWLRILSGAFSTGNNPTNPITFKAYFRVAPPIQLGFTNNAPAPQFFPGNVIATTTTSLTARGLAFDASEAVTVLLDGTPVTATGATTGSDGSFTATVSVPAGQTPGAHELTFSTSTVTHEAPLEIVRHTATLVTPSVRPGNTVVVDVAGFRSISGGGQKVALNLAGTVIACAQTDATGSARIVATVPAGTAEGNPSLTALAGRECVIAPPPIVTEPVPRTAPNTLAVSSTAIEATSPFVRGSVGGSFPVAGSGFGSGEAITVQLDGVTVGSGLTAAADGTFSGSVTIPAATALGERLLTFTSATAGAALTFEAVPAPTAAITSTGPLHPGSTLSFSFTGFARGDGTGGQKVAVKIDSGEVVACLDDVDDDGAASGTVTLPADLELGAHTLRLLAGTSCVSAGPQNDLPARTLGVPFTVTAAPDDGDDGGDGGGGGTPVPPVVTPPTPPAPGGGGTTLTPAAAKGVKRAGARLRLTFARPLAAGTRVTVRSARKVRLRSGAKARLVTLATLRSAKAGGTATVKLTRDGRRLLRRLRKLKVVVTVVAPGGATSRRTLTLRR